MRGVYAYPGGKRFRVRVAHNGREFNGGTYDTIEEGRAGGNRTASKVVHAQRERQGIPVTSPIDIEGGSALVDEPEATTPGRTLRVAQHPRPPT